MARAFKISRTQYDRVWGYIEAGKQEGAKAVLGGVKRSGKGFFVDPTGGFFYASIAALLLRHSHRYSFYSPYSS